MLFIKTIVVIAVVIGLFFSASWAIKQTANLPSAGDMETTTNLVDVLSSTTFFDSAFTLILGPEALVSDQLFIIYLAIFVLILFTFKDIVGVFSTFGMGESNATPWVIGAAFALILSALGVTQSLVVALGIGASVGVWVVVIILISAFVAALAVNVGLGGDLQKWTLKRKIMMDAMKADKGAEEVAGAITNLKKVESSFESGAGI